MTAFEKLQQVKEMITQLVIYHLFKENYKLIATDLSTQQALDADSKAMQQFYFDK